MHKHVMVAWAVDHDVAKQPNNQAAVQWADGAVQKPQAGCSVAGKCMHKVRQSITLTRYLPERPGASWFPAKHMA